MSKWLFVALLGGSACATDGVPPAPPGPSSSDSVADCPSAEGIPDDKVVATWAGGQVTFGALQEKVGAEVRMMDIQHQISRYDVQSQGLDRLVVESLLAAEAKRLGHPDSETLLAKEVADKVPKPTEQEIADFYPVFARQL